MRLGKWRKSGLYIIDTRGTDGTPDVMRREKWVMRRRIVDSMFGSRCTGSATRSYTERRKTLESVDASLFMTSAPRRQPMNPVPKLIS